MSANVPDNLENNTLFVPTGANFQDVLNSLHENGQLIDTSSFRKVSELMHYTDGKIKPGRYKIFPSSSNRSLIAQLRIGNQEPVNLVLTHGWLLEDVAVKAAQFIEADSTDIIQPLNDQNYIQS